MKRGIRLSAKTGRSCVWIKLDQFAHMLPVLRWRNCVGTRIDVNLEAVAREEDLRY